jgi:soluble lytic murein transglycosylase-like protein
MRSPSPGARGRGVRLRAACLIGLPAERPWAGPRRLLWGTLLLLGICPVVGVQAAEPSRMPGPPSVPGPADRSHFQRTAVALPGAPTAPAGAGGGTVLRAPLEPLAPQAPAARAASAAPAAAAAPPDRAEVCQTADASAEPARAGSPAAIAALGGLAPAADLGDRGEDPAFALTPAPGSSEGIAGAASPGAAGPGAAGSGAAAVSTPSAAAPVPAPPSQAAPAPPPPPARARPPQPAMGFDAAARVPRRPYGKLIYQIARNYALNPSLVAAIAKVESDFNPRARSRKGACGLMQVLPSTARRFGLPRRRDLFNPRKNIEAASRYLRWLVDRFGEDPIRVLAAYNAGEGAVDRFGGVPPFAETRGYVTRIFSLLGFTALLDAPVLAAAPSATVVPVTAATASALAADGTR